MRVLLGTESGDRDWIPEVRDVATCYQVARFLRKRVVATVPESELNAAKAKVRSEIADQEARRLLQDVLATLPVARDGAPNAQILLSDGDSSDADPPHVLVDQLPGLQLANALIDAFDEPRTINRGRMEVFDEYLAPLASTAWSAVLLDRYLAASLVQHGNRSGGAWLVQRLVQVGLSDLTVLTTHSSLTASDVTDLTRSHVVFPRGFHLTVVVAPESCRAHDRHLRFRYGHRQSTSILLGKGADVFSRERIQDSYAILCEGTQSARDRESLLENGPERSRHDVILL